MLISGFTVLFLSKNTQAQASICDLVCYYGAKYMTGFSTILCVSDNILELRKWSPKSNLKSSEYIPLSEKFLTNCFEQSAHNFKVVCLIDRTTLWQEFMMHLAITIEENGEENLRGNRRRNIFFIFRFNAWPGIELRLYV